MFKSSTTSSLREYTGIEIFDSGISSIKHQIAFMATLLLYKSGTIWNATSFESNGWACAETSVCSAKNRSI